MAAEDHLAGRQFMYHVAPQHYRGGIQRGGLSARENFISTEPLQYSGTDYGEGKGPDVWQVDTSGLELQHDYGFGKGEGHPGFVQSKKAGWKSYYTTQKVELHRMQLIAEGVRNR